MDSATNSLLLEHLRDNAHGPAWTEFDRRFRPIILATARRCGLSEADAADAAQETLLQFVRDYRAGRYERERGRLRSWLIGITRHRVADMRRSRAARHEARGPSAIDREVADGEVDRVWDDEERAALLREALSLLRERTRTGDSSIRAFELLVLDGVPADEVAARIGLTVHNVYVVKARVTERLRGVIEELKVRADI